MIPDGDDIYGDGVDIAARLEAMAEPGGIVVSGPAFEQVVGKVDCGFADLGECRLKNIARPVRVYRLLSERSAAGYSGGQVRSRRYRWVALAIALGLVAASGMAGSEVRLAWRAHTVRGPRAGDRRRACHRGAAIRRCRAQWGRPLCRRRIGRGCRRRPLAISGADDHRAECEPAAADFQQGFGRHWP